MIMILASSIAVRVKELFSKMEKDKSRLEACELEKTLFEKFKLQFERICEEHRMRKEKKTKKMSYWIKGGGDAKICGLCEDTKGTSNLMVRYCERR